jgi:hypothetical protein
MTVDVGMDVHRKRSQVAIVDAAGVPQRNRNLANDPVKLIPVLGVLPPGTPVAFEAAYGWGWLVDLLEELELEPHLVHPSHCKAIASARLKNDKVDAATLAQLLRADLLPEAWIAPQATTRDRHPGQARPTGPGAHGPARGWPADRHGHIAKQGSPWVRGILQEAAQTAKRHPVFASAYAQLARRRGSHIATTAIARRLLARSFPILTQLETPPTSEKASTGRARVPHAPAIRPLT